VSGKIFAIPFFGITITGRRPSPSTSPDGSWNAFPIFETSKFTGSLSYSTPSNPLTSTNSAPDPLDTKIPTTGGCPLTALLSLKIHVPSISPPSFNRHTIFPLFALSNANKLPCSVPTRINLRSPKASRLVLPSSISSYFPVAKWRAKVFNPEGRSFNCFKCVLTRVTYAESKFPVETSS